MVRTTLLLSVGLFAATLLTNQVGAATSRPDAKAYPVPQKHYRQTELSTAAIDQSRDADYKAAKAKAQAEYKQATAKCRKRSRSAVNGCMNDAKAVRTEALAQAKTRWGKQQ